MSASPSEIRALVFDGRLHLVPDYPVPRVPAGWALIRVQKAGICKTDLEEIMGYAGFKGVLGHEFIGTVSRCDAPAWVGRRVAGEINIGCGHCLWCEKGMERHCSNRKVLGIHGHDGCMAEYCTLPISNLVEIPAVLPDDRAVFLEPLSAACEILEQLPLHGTEKAVVLGDGRLGILCAWVLCTALSDVTLVGHHPEKLELSVWRGLKRAEKVSDTGGRPDIVVEATGSGGGLTEAMALCRPRGTIVLKSTVASQGELNLAPVVVNEISVVGSRCGRFRDGLHMLESYPDMPLERLITGRYPLEQAVAAFKRASAPGTLKVLLDIHS